MKMTEKIQLAMYVSIAAHEAVGQVGKYTNEPYWKHPDRVARILSRYVEDVTEDMICASLLHDVIEDTLVTIETIRMLFGDNVAYMVLALTDVYTKEAYPLDNRYVRKSLEAIRLAKTDAQIQTIKVADLIDNTTSIVQQGDGFARNYMGEKSVIINSFTKANKRLLGIARGLIDDFNNDKELRISL